MTTRGHIAILLTAVAFAAFARKATMPQLPASVFADTEVVTNMPMPASVDGSPVFTTLSAAPPPWLHDPAWNMVRLRGCGNGILGETFSVAASADGTTFFLR